MIIVEPNSNLEFFYNTGLSITHENSLYFPSTSAKDNYFGGVRSIVIGKCTYQRSNQGFCRVQIPIANLYNVDYMRFKNINFENKWFYAFVLSVNYINNETTEVQYLLDPLITWMGDFSLEQCYIERQHVRNDNIGANICEEGLGVGNYCTELQTSIWTTAPSHSIARIAVANGDGITNAMGGIYSGSSVIDCTSQERLNNAIKSLIDSNESDSIVSVTMVPISFAGWEPRRIVNNTIPKPYRDIMGYVPRNKKLFCYPYKYCTIDNREGSTLDLMYEYMGSVPDATSSGNMSFIILGQSYPSSCELVCFPDNYKGSTGSEYRITMNHFPVCSFSVDSYQAYLAQKNAYFKQDLALTTANGAINTMASTAHGAINGAASGAIIGQIPGALFGGAIGAMQGASNGVVDATSDILSTVTNNMIINSVRPESPSTQKGSETPDIWFSTNGKGFSLYEKCITKNYAMMLDSYFDMFGYAVKQHGTPNMNARPHWTYVKTIGCNVKGNLPASDSRDIEGIFDAGCRFWHNLIEMGNYGLDNSPR